MEKVRLTKLSEPVRSFLARVNKGRGLLVEDAEGREVARVLPAGGKPAARKAVEVPRAEREAAWKWLQQFQRKASKTAAAQGITEEDVIREVLKDD